MKGDSVEELVAGAGVPPRFAACRLETFEPGRAKAGATALQACRDLVEKPAGLVLAGPVGTGKTHLAVATITARAGRYLRAWPVEWQVQPEPGGPWLNEGDGIQPTSRAAIHRRRPPFRDRFVSVPALLDRLRFWCTQTSAADPLEDLMATDGVLVLDDLGRERLTDWASERLYLLVNTRYEQLRPTVVTTNLDLSQPAVSAQYDAMLSRVLEGGRLIQLGGADQRLRPRRSM